MKFGNNLTMEYFNFFKTGGGAMYAPSKDMKGANVHHSKLPRGQKSGYPGDYERLAYE
jgi:hypothetical protein